ncbi:hypothetical protein ACWCQZ_44285 [Streptomyces sp. NPDC002285]
MAELSTAAGEAWMRGELDSRAYFAMARRGAFLRVHRPSWWAWLVSGWRRG